MTTLLPLNHLSPQRFETPTLLKKLAVASRQLAELKGVVASIPNQSILISTLGIQEAKDSSAIENIVTTHDELFKDDAFPESLANPAAKEVLRYRQALRIGFEAVRQSGLQYSASPVGAILVIAHRFKAKTSFAPTKTRSHESSD